jgi:16S rRNA processing protein RimM
VDEPESYEDLESLFLEVKGQLVPFFVESIRVRGKKAIVKFEDVSSVEKAMQLKSCHLYLPTEVLPELEEGKFYYHEIIGYTVVDEEKGTLGTVTSVYTLPQQELVAMDYQNVEVLIPLNEAIVLQVNREQKTLITRLPGGLLELYLDDNHNESEN